METWDSSNGEIKEKDTFSEIGLVANKYAYSVGGITKVLPKEWI